MKENRYVPAGPVDALVATQSCAHRIRRMQLLIMAVLLAELLFPQSATASSAGIAGAVGKLLFLWVGLPAMAIGFIGALAGNKGLARSIIVCGIVVLGVVAWLEWHSPNFPRFDRIVLTGVLVTAVAGQCYLLSFAVTRGLLFVVKRYVLRIKPEA